MNKSVEETRRQLFEHDYVQYRQYLKRNKDGSYNEEWVESRWQGFNAAFDLIEIQLPSKYKTEEGYSMYDVAEVIACIHNINLGLKIK